MWTEVDNSGIVPPLRKEFVTVGSKKTNARIHITADTIRALASKPLAKAAKSVGISETALKRACRELGFEKWPRQSVEINFSYDSVKEEFSRTYSDSDSSSVCSSAPTNASPSPASEKSGDLSHTNAPSPEASHTISCPHMFVFPAEDSSGLGIDADLDFLRVQLMSGPLVGVSKTEFEKEFGMDDMGRHCFLSASLTRSSRQHDCQDEPVLCVSHFDQQRTFDSGGRNCFVVPF